ncbi:hypothetical protein M422DRAFT_182639, partial [Sphaerobolus stellatus SS14]
MDETGFVLSDSGSRCVIGHKGTKRQHRQGSGDRENITVIITICADGTVLRPTIIFKGQNHMKKWHDNNVSGASICHSPNGWTDSDLAISWFKKDFDPQTQDKANGGWRCLILDGHGSHYPTKLLHCALEVQCTIIGYPSHSTHALQGLDVVCFSRMKDIYRQEVQAFEENHGHKMNKGDFGGVFGAAFHRAFTPETIKTAFRVTGIHPFNPNIISESQMKPSEVTSVKGSFPLPQPSPVRRIMATYHHQTVTPSLPLVTHTNLSSPQQGGPSELDPNIDPSLYTPSKRVRVMTATLSQSESASYLVSASPIKSTRYLPSPVLEAPPRENNPNWDLL